MIKVVIRLIRLPNLAMVFLTMYLMRWSIVRPILDLMGFEPVMPEITFFLLVLSTIFITAAGSVINDYHDVVVDRVNYPDRVIIDRHISRRQAIIIHFVLSMLGIVLGLLVSFYHRLFIISPVFLIMPAVLWFYSTTFKHRLIIGNLLISLLVAMVPLLVILFEYPLLLKENQDILQKFPNFFHPVLYWVALFSLFAFLTNLIKEIVKDAEGLIGDREIGSKTIAVVHGVRTSKTLAIILSVITLSGIGIIFFLFLKDWLSLSYFGLFLALPFLILIINLIRVNGSPGYGRIIQLAKMIMLTGLIYAPIAYIVMKFVLI